MNCFNESPLQRHAAVPVLLDQLTGHAPVFGLRSRVSGMRSVRGNFTFTTPGGYGAAAPIQIPKLAPSQRASGWWWPGFAEQT